jgi:hypothetical protein
MLYCGSTSGGRFERRAMELKNHPDIVEAIARNAGAPDQTEDERQ